MGKLTHIKEDGSVQMVDVGHKSPTERKAVYRAKVFFSKETFELIQNNALPKGDVLTTAKIAGIQAAKMTPHLIPMCHPIFLSHMDIRFYPDPSTHSITIEAEAKTTAQTGVEMEAMVGAMVAAMTIYDMCKAVQKDIIITDCKLLYKSGGKSGTYCSEEFSEKDKCC